MEREAQVLVDAIKAEMGHFMSGDEESWERLANGILEKLGEDAPRYISELRFYRECWQMTEGLLRVLETTFSQTGVASAEKVKQAQDLIGQFSSTMAAMIGG